MANNWCVPTQEQQRQYEQLQYILCWPNPLIDHLRHDKPLADFDWSEIHDYVYEDDVDLCEQDCCERVAGELVRQVLQP